MAKPPPKTTLETKGHLGLWQIMTWITIVSTGVLGVAYLGAQFVYDRGPVDHYFVLIIFANTCIAAGFGFHFEHRLRALLTAFNAMEADRVDPIDPRQAFRNIFNHSLALPAAIGFALFVSGWVYLLAPWAPWFSGTGNPNDLTLNRLLVGFLFCGNLMIGYGLYCIIRFWLLAARRIDAVVLDIFNPTRPDIALYQDTTRRIVILVALVATLAVISLSASKIEVGATVVLFSVASLATVIAAYLVPMLPLTAKFQQTRYAEMHRIERRLDAIYEQMVEADDPSVHRKTFDEFTALRDQVKAVKTLPPGGEFSIFTAFGVSLLTFIPTIIERVLSLFPFGL